MIKLKKYNFKSIITLLSGNLGAQVATFISGLVLARQYTPEDFGILGVFLAISNIFIPISCLGYEAAIVISKDLKEAFAVSILCLIISSIFSFLLYLPIAVYKTQIISLFNCAELYPWIYLLPVSVLLGGVFNVLNYFNTKIKQYKDISVSNVLKSVYCALVQILGSLVKDGPCMLVVGQSTMNLFGNIRLFKNILSSRSVITLTRIKSVGKRFNRFPKFYFWGVLANNISLNVSSLLIKKLFSSADVGFYSYAYKYIGFPISLIASSTGQIYYQEISEARINGGNPQKVFRETVMKLLILGIPIFVTIYFFIEPGFIFLFGERWKMAGEMGKILTPLYFIRFITSPLSMTLLAYEKQNYLLFWQLTLMISTILPYIITILYNGNIIEYLQCLVCCLSLCYILYFIAIYLIIKNSK